jgi:hypothetical protein
MQSLFTMFIDALTLLYKILLNFAEFFALGNRLDALFEIQTRIQYV